MKKIFLLLSFIITISSLVYSQELNRTKNLYQNILNDPFNIMDDLVVLADLEKKNDLTQQEIGWAALAACELTRNAGYKAGYFVDPESYELEFIEKSEEILALYQRDEDSYPYYVFEKTLNEILLGKETNIEEAGNYSNYPVITLVKGLNQFSTKEYQEAINILTTISDKDASWERWWANRYIALSYQELNQPDKVEEFLKKNIEFNPEFPYFYEHLGSFYYKQRKYEDALKTVRTGLTKGKYPNLVALLDNIYAKKLSLPPY